MKKLISITLVTLVIVFTMIGCKKNYTITVKSNNEAWGAVTGSGTYKEGEVVTISAVSAEGYYFICWNDGDKTNPRQIVVSGNVEYIATFSNTSGGGGGGGNDMPEPEIIHNAVMDIDGHQYDAVKIGNQVWMAQNLRTTHYADGTAIPTGENYSSYHPYYYVNPDLDANVYGYYYNQRATMHGAASSDANPSGVQGVCPNGWHLPSDAEWTQLTDYLNSHEEYRSGGFDGCVAKALASTNGWHSSPNSYAVGNNQTSNNATGFSAVPAGIGFGNSSFMNVGNETYFWSSTEGWGVLCTRRLRYNDAEVWRGWIGDEGVAVSVRCLRD